MVIGAETCDTANHSRAGNASVEQKIQNRGVRGLPMKPLRHAMKSFFR
jgi:hypothetical protein